MRFIIEFEVPENVYLNSKSRYIPEKRHLGEVKLGNMIAESFGWQNPVNHDLDHHRLEIEAFPIDKWVDFEKRFYEAIPDCDTVSRIRLINALTALMTFNGKPSGDAIANLPDLEYRGPDSHCKACEDERAGIKHIQSQRHTCKK